MEREDARLDQDPPGGRSAACRSPNFVYGGGRPRFLRPGQGQRRPRRSMPHSPHRNGPTPHRASKSAARPSSIRTSPPWYLKNASTRNSTCSRPSRGWTCSRVGRRANFVLHHFNSLTRSQQLFINRSSERSGPGSITQLALPVAGEQWCVPVYNLVGHGRGADDRRGMARTWASWFHRESSGHNLDSPNPPLVLRPGEQVPRAR